MAERLSDEDEPARTPRRQPDTHPWKGARFGRLLPGGTIKTSLSSTSVPPAHAPVKE